MAAITGRLKFSIFQQTRLDSLPNSLPSCTGLGSHLGDVSACNEGVDGPALLVDGGRTGQNDCVNVVQILSQLVECLFQLCVHVGGQSVHGLHVLDLNDGNMALFFDYYVSHF